MSTTATPPLIPSDANHTALLATRPNVLKGTLTVATVTAGTVNAAAGAITVTQTSAIATTTKATAVITNSFCSATSTVLVSIGSYAGNIGTNGSPSVWATPAEGSFTLTVANEGVTAANLSGALVIDFLIV